MNSPHCLFFNLPLCVLLSHFGVVLGQLRVSPRHLHVGRLYQLVMSELIRRTLVNFQVEAEKAGPHILREDVGDYGNKQPIPEVIIQHPNIDNHMSNLTHFNHN